MDNLLVHQGMSNAKNCRFLLAPRRVFILMEELHMSAITLPNFRIISLLLYFIFNGAIAGNHILQDES